METKHEQTPVDKICTIPNYSAYENSGFDQFKQQSFGHETSFSWMMCDSLKRLSALHQKSSRLEGENKQVVALLLTYQQRLHEAQFRLQHYQKLQFKQAVSRHKRRASRMEKENQREQVQLAALQEFLKKENLKFAMSFFESETQREIDEMRHQLVQHGLKKRLEQNAIVIEQQKKKAQALELNIKKLQEKLHKSQAHREKLTKSLYQAKVLLQELTTQVLSADIKISKLKKKESDLTHQVKVQNETISSLNLATTQMEINVLELEEQVADGLHKLDECHQKEDYLNNTIKGTRDLLYKAKKKLYKTKWRLSLRSQSLKEAQFLHQNEANMMKNHCKELQHNHQKTLKNIIESKQDLLNENRKLLQLKESLEHESTIISQANIALNEKVLILKKQLRETSQLIASLQERIRESELQLLEREHEIQKVNLEMSHWQHKVSKPSFASSYTHEPSESCHKPSPSVTTFLHYNPSKRLFSQHKVSPIAIMPQKPSLTKTGDVSSVNPVDRICKNQTLSSDTTNVYKKSSPIELEDSSKLTYMQASETPSTEKSIKKKTSQAPKLIDPKITRNANQEKNGLKRAIRTRKFTEFDTKHLSRSFSTVQQKNAINLHSKLKGPVLLNSSSSSNNSITSITTESITHIKRK